MLPCAKHSDCIICGRHPLTSQHYKCVQRYVLYDTVVTSNNNDVVFVNTTGGSSSAFDPDVTETAITGKHGICIDIDPSMNEGCSNQVVAMVKDGAIGCLDGPPAKYLCGLSVDVKHGDLSTVETSGNLFWPRVLLNGASDHDGDGQADPEMKCYDPIGKRILNPPFALSPTFHTTQTHPHYPCLRRLHPEMPLPRAHGAPRSGRAAHVCIVRTLPTLEPFFLDSLFAAPWLLDGDWRYNCGCCMVPCPIVTLCTILTT